MRRNQRSPGDARRRTGCWSCKSKHVRCTEERPQCARCTKLGVRCEYGIRLLWQQDAAQRGICLGREGAWSKHGKPKPKPAPHAPTSTPHFVTPGNEPIFLHTACRHFRSRGADDQHEAEADEDYSEAEDTTSTLCTRRPPWSAPRLPLSPFRTRPLNEAYLLDYFISAICPNCSLDSTDNPYLSYITPMALVYPPLHDAVIAIAATERSLLNDPRFEKEAWWYKSRALKGLQASIADGSVSWPFIATVLMLCFGDIADGCNDSWRTHLRGGLTTLNELHTDCTESQMLRKFCLMYFVAHDIMGHTAGGSDVEPTPYTWLEDDDMEEIDPIMGCSRGLLDIINRISIISSDVKRLLSRRVLSIDEVRCFEQSRSQLERALYAIRQVPPPTTTNPDIARVAEAKRTAALLYLYERFASVPQASSGSDPSETMRHHINRLVNALILQLGPLPVTPTLLWPLFVLGNASPGDEEHRRFVLERLGRMLRGRNLGSVRLARRLMERKFRRWDLQVCEPDSPIWMEGKMAGNDVMRGLRGKWVSLA
ncbi:fungal-specific transcription factor domain-containing protein [Massariosphaeria phaeospora]|uniref:Fungal-specific transcription factor domain-containing protein n=1 Tax=Massariosphaeria phaeospora TaxID=100035 RepID=A0A7C8I068_9PLEO|nr:fungal-specific transcription factor domain-containing protein [Massariosphaeria phaeospora]